MRYVDVDNKIQRLAEVLADDNWDFIAEGQDTQPFADDLAVRLQVAFEDWLSDRSREPLESEKEGN